MYSRKFLWVFLKKHLFFFLVTYKELKVLLAQSKFLILIDVRETDEVNKGRIPRSTHIARKN